MILDLLIQRLKHPKWCLPDSMNKPDLLPTQCLCGLEEWRAAYARWKGMFK